METSAIWRIHGQGAKGSVLHHFRGGRDLPRGLLDGGGVDQEGLVRQGCRAGAVPRGDSHPRAGPGALPDSQGCRAEADDPVNVPTNGQRGTKLLTFS